jgi:hypothetical protein
MRVVEVLDSENINSQDIEKWIEECQKFKAWYLKTATHQPNDVEMEKAYLKIEVKQKRENSLYKILENER